MDSKVSRLVVFGLGIMIMRIPRIIRTMPEAITSYSFFKTFTDTYLNLYVYQFNSDILPKRPRLLSPTVSKLVQNYISSLELTEPLKHFASERRP